MQLAMLKTEILPSMNGTEYNAAHTNKQLHANLNKEHHNSFLGEWHVLFQR